MIGSGIFIVSAEIARTVNSAGLLLVVWGIAAAMTLIAALSYGELAAAMPQAGGQADSMSTCAKPSLRSTDSSTAGRFSW